MRRIPASIAAVALTLPYERPLNDGFRILDGEDRERLAGESVYCTRFRNHANSDSLRGRSLLQPT